MEKIEILQKSFRADYEAEAETEAARYGLRYATEEGRLTHVSAQVEMKAGGESGCLSWDRGSLRVEMFPYGEDGQAVDAAVADFRKVVGTLSGEDAGADGPEPAADEEEGKEA